MQINHNFFDSRSHEVEMREAAARRLELEAAHRILEAEAKIGEEALVSTVEVRPGDTEEPSQRLAA